VRYVTALQEGVKTESCFTIKARERLAVCPEPQCTGAADMCNADN